VDRDAVDVRVPVPHLGRVHCSLCCLLHSPVAGRRFVSSGCYGGQSNVLTVHVELLSKRRDGQKQINKNLDYFVKFVLLHHVISCHPLQVNSSIGVDFDLSL
jgi:hypothetical protein